MLAKHSEVDKTVFVGNLHSSVKEEILFELFLQAGPLKKVTIARDREGRQRSYGFVCYKHPEAVPYAIALLNGIRLYGRPIKLQYSSGSSHSDGGTGPSDPPLEPHSASPVFPESPVFHFSAFPNNRCLSQDLMHWTSMVCGFPPQQFPLNVSPPQSQCYAPPAVLCPSVPPLPWSTLGFPPWTQPPPPKQPSGSSLPALPPSPPPGPERQGGAHADGTEPGRPRKRRKNRKQRKAKKRRSAEKAGRHVAARSHARAGKHLHTAVASFHGKDGETSDRKDSCN